MTEQKRERGIKVLVKRKIFLKELAKAGSQKTALPGDIITLSAAEVKQYGPTAVTRDLPDGVDED